MFEEKLKKYLLTNCQSFRDWFKEVDIDTLSSSDIHEAIVDLADIIEEEYRDKHRWYHLVTYIGKIDDVFVRFIAVETIGDSYGCDDYDFDLLEYTSIVEAKTIVVETTKYVDVLSKSFLVEEMK